MTDSQVAEITTWYIQGIQNMSECATHKTLKHMNGRRLDRVPLPSDKNRKLRIQFKQVHRKLPDWKKI